MKRLDLALFGLLVLCGILVVHTQHRARRQFVDLQRELSLGEQLASDLRRLQSDQATLAAANRVERAAVGLHLRPPDPARTLAMASPSGSAAAAMPGASAGADAAPAGRAGLPAVGATGTPAALALRATLMIAGGAAR
jgi:cell division protein FtsL